ncbi:MAG TPA: phosphoribosylformylglycinamidine cyclo-ligase [Gammaproteobacteria bacterium]|nr:phosphoribosylformylglycinamidine cyclo-ligase [Gammaproteobacteria bacterium]
MKYRVDIDVANDTKAGLSSVIDGKDGRVLNRVGAFASLFALDARRYRDPVLVQKTEEPGSKQVLAFKHDRIESVCYDMINHLINDCVVMGAEPLAIQDLIICGRMEKSAVTRIVSACAAAAAAQGCALTGGETTEQPDVVANGVYVLGSSIVGVVERDQVIDGSKIRRGDVVIALASSGPHTNGYTLIRDLLKRSPALADEKVGAATFLDAVLEPHRCYYQALKGLFPRAVITGLAHITGGGVRENLDRILPDGVDASIDLGLYQTPAVFDRIRRAAGSSPAEMLRAFNLGVGLALVCRERNADAVLEHLNGAGEHAYAIGEIVAGSGVVQVRGEVRYQS